MPLGLRRERHTTCPARRNIRQAACGSTLSEANVSTRQQVWHDHALRFKLDILIRRRVHM